MLKLDDTEFLENTIIDLVVLPDMPVYSIIMELARPARCKIILDTQGNLYWHFTAHSMFPEAGGHKQSHQADTQSRTDADALLEKAVQPLDQAIRRSDSFCILQAEDAQTSSVDYTLEDAGASFPASDIVTSSMDYLSQHFIEMEDVDGQDGIQHYFIDDFGQFCRKLEDLRNYSDFILIIDSITFACDSSPFDLQTVINLLWSLVYSCKATVITINHYRVGKRKRTYGLVPRMGARWAAFVSYQVLFSYKRGEIVFSVAEPAQSKCLSSPLSATADSIK